VGLLEPQSPVSGSSSGLTLAYSGSVMEALGKPPVAPMAQMSKPVPVAVVSEDSFHSAIRSARLLKKSFS
jgi:hypothetical protein